MSWWSRDPTPAPSVVGVGVGPGIGTAVARRFAREGHLVGMIARRDETLYEAVAALGDAATTWTVAADATDEPGELDAATMLDTYAVNVVGAITTASALLPAMESGTFVVTSGMPSPDPGLTSLSLGKVGVRGLVDLRRGARGGAGTRGPAPMLSSAVSAASVRCEGSTSQGETSVRR